MATIEHALSTLAGLTPPQIRHCIREGQWRRPTSGLAPGYTQANLAIVPRALAYDFLLFCQRNPKPCPLLEVLDAGDPEPRECAPGADIRTDIPRYRVYRQGVLADEVDDLTPYWRDDLVSFLLGCSFTFEHPLLDAGIGVRHIELGVNVPMFITNRPCHAAGVFQGPMVVSMRPIPTPRWCEPCKSPVAFRQCMGRRCTLAIRPPLAFATCNDQILATRCPLRQERSRCSGPVA